MKQILLGLLLVASSICDKLDRRYLPSKPDPFNNGQVSDTVLKSATPLLPDSSKLNGGSFGTDAANKQYLPPRDLENQPKYGATNSELTRPNDRFDEPSRAGYYQNLKGSNGFSSTVHENKPTYGAPTGGLTKDIKFSEPSRGGQYTPSLTGNGFSSKVYGNKPQDNDGLTRGTSGFNEPSRVGQYTPNTNGNAFGSIGVPSDVHDRTPNYSAGLTRGPQQINEPQRGGQYTPSSNANGFSSKGVQPQAQQTGPSYSTQNGGTRDTGRFTEAPRNGQYTPNSNGNSLSTTGISSYVQESKPEYGIQNGGLTKGIEPSRSGQYTPIPNNNSFNSKGVPSYVQENKPEFGIQNGGLTKGTEPSRIGQYTPASNGNGFISEGVPTYAQENKPGYGSQNGGLTRGPERVNEFPRDGQYAPNSNGNTFIPSGKYPDAGQYKPENIQKENEPNRATGFPGSYDNHDSIGKYASNGQFATPTSPVPADATPSKGPVGYYRGEDIQPNFNNQAKILRYENNVNAGDGAYNYLFDTDNGIHVEEEGSGVDQTKTAQGGYSYTSPEGEQINVEYFADKDGYHPKGSHVPEIPDAILRSIEFNKAEEARGIKYDDSNTDDGQYKDETSYGSGSSGPSSYSPSGPNSTPANVQKTNEYSTGAGGFGYGSSGPSEYPSFQRKTSINTPSTLQNNVQSTNQYSTGPVGNRGSVGNNGSPLNGDRVTQKYEGPSAGGISTDTSSYRGYNNGKNSGYEPQSQKGNAEFSGTEGGYGRDSNGKTSPTEVKSNLDGFGTVPNTLLQNSYSSFSNNQDNTFGQVNKDAATGQGTFNGYFNGGYQTERTDKFAGTTEIPLRESTSKIFENNKYGADANIRDSERPSGLRSVPDIQGKDRGSSEYQYGGQATKVHNGGPESVGHVTSNGYFNGGYQTERTEKFAGTTEIPLRDSTSKIFENNKYGTDANIRDSERPSGLGSVPDIQGKERGSPGYHYGGQATKVQNGGPGSVGHGFAGHIDELKGARQPISPSGILNPQSYQQPSGSGKFGNNDRLPESKPYATHFDEKTGYKY